MDESGPNTMENCMCNQIDEDEPLWLLDDTFCSNVGGLIGFVFVLGMFYFLLLLVFGIKSFAVLYFVSFHVDNVYNYICFILLFSN